MAKSNYDMFITEYNRSYVVRCLVSVAKLLGYLLPFHNDSSLFLFFPFYHVGGAEKVHAEIVACLSDKRPWVFFTKRSYNKGFLELFATGARLFNVWFLLKYGYPLSVGVMAGFINRHTLPVVFGSNSLYYYLLLPYLRPGVRRVDLLHAFGGGSENFSLPVVKELDARVVINRQTIADIREQYEKNGFPYDLGNRVVLIENFVAVADEYPAKPRREQLKILYVGRSSEEKRVHLVGRIAARCHAKGLPAEFVLVGDTMHAVPQEDRIFCSFAGELADAAQLDAIYADSDLLLVTSSREGFPMVIMEGMAHGVVPLSTSVGGIAAHVQNGVTGWLVDSAANEDAIVESMCRIIEKSCADRDTLGRMSRAAHSYAYMNFKGEKFCTLYRELLLNHGKQK